MIGETIRLIFVDDNRKEYIDRSRMELILFDHTRYTIFRLYICSLDRYPSGF